MADPIPETLGVCPVCWGEFSVPDAKPGDTCPAGPHYAMEDTPLDDPPMVIFTRSGGSGEVPAGLDDDTGNETSGPGGCAPSDDVDALRGALAELVMWAEEARGHYGIEECAGPTQPATEWDDIQEGLATAARLARELLPSAPEAAGPRTEPQADASKKEEPDVS